ncbi:hypothetical protein [Cellulomonas sp.]|uniref:hypothetical protein n=1 Tax=Cellulomonas sp. TaxID=40001 RepID=UPI001AFCDA13|nr:hypothetical protein [Cellulomonas sp.]MBO9556730.1 hypothetical protein [Cellulomonas sp.]
MSTVVTIQPGQPGMGLDYDVREPLPYPFHVDVATGDCTRGRGTAEAGDDPTGTTPWRLLGFQRGDVQELVLTLRDFAADPQSAVGLVPVFLNWRGGVFSLAVPITNVTVHGTTDHAAVTA